MVTRFPWRRAVAVGLAMLLIVAACLCYLRYAPDLAGLRYWRRFGYMAAFNADLAKPGEYSVSFEARDIDPALALELPKDLGLRTSPDKLLSGLRATTQLIDSRGELMYEGPIPAEAPRFFPPGSGRILLVEYGYVGADWNRINVTISQPALALKAVPHRLLVMSRATNRSARSAMRFLGHAALFTATVILMAVAITSRRKPRIEKS